MYLNTVLYLDSENNPAPKKLKDDLLEKIKEEYPRHHITWEKLVVELQRYNNCGPEVVENFIEYLIGKRIDQESAVALHSMLYEDSILY